MGEMLGLPEDTWLLGSLSRGCQVLHHVFPRSWHVIDKVSNARVRVNEVCNSSGANASDRCHTAVVPLAHIPHVMNTKAVHHFPHYGTPRQSSLHSLKVVHLWEGALLQALVS